MSHFCGSLFLETGKTIRQFVVAGGNSASIFQALDVCRDRHYVEEQIFVLERMGNVLEALELITNDQLDIHAAVAFCKRHDDPELWSNLVESSLDKPYFVHVLLHNIGTHVDPRILISKIRPGQEIPGLRDSLVQIMTDYRLQVSLQEGCKRILAADCHQMLAKLVKMQAKGLSVSEDRTCAKCQTKIVGSDQDILVFGCGHVFLADCCPNAVCSICHPPT